jgi:hypothetical protein
MKLCHGRGLSAVGMDFGQDVGVLWRVLGIVSVFCRSDAAGTVFLRISREREHGGCLRRGAVNGLSVAQVGTAPTDRAIARH